MLERFEWKKFSEVSLDDPFFDSLKDDYTEFVDWFKRKCDAKETALVNYDFEGIVAFIYLKNENESIELTDKTLPKKQRLKIGTLKLSERIRSQRLGEGALGVALWYWQKTKCEEIYLTVFDKHEKLISILDKFGFEKIGKNSRGESIYLKSRENIDFSTPYKSFPFISSVFECAGVIPIEEEFHDKLFPYSELYGNDRNVEEITAGNGVTKVYIATPMKKTAYKEGMPVFIYRKYNGPGQKTFNSVITSLCTISKITVIKSNYVENCSFEEFVAIAGNKTVYPEETLREIYNSKSTIIAIELVYNAFFGKGHNVTHAKLTSNGLFDGHPYQIVYNRKEFDKVLELGGKDVQDIIIN